jgi:uncharacterized membrane protein YfcA
MAWMDLMFLALATFVGAAAIRLTGLGFSLIASSVFVLISGPVEGVQLANLMTPVTNVLVLRDTWRQVQLRRALLLAAPAVVTVPVGAMVAHWLSRAPLMVVIGCLMLSGLLVTVFDKHLEWLGSRLGAIGLGVFSGFANATAGLGGVGLALYGRATKWPQKQFLPSAQVYLFTINVASLLIKGPPHVQAGTLAMLVLAALAGTALGAQLAGEVKVKTARKLILAMAFAGSLLTIAKGLAAL